MKFMHTADIHLGAEPDKGMPWSRMRHDEIFVSFYQLLDIAAEERIDLLLIAGDLFHRQPLKRELKELNYRFEGIPDIKIVIIAGNHDYIRNDSYYRNFEWAENVYFFDSDELEMFCFDDIQTCVYGLSYHHYEIASPLYDNIAPDRRLKRMQHVLLAHGGDEKHIPIRMPQLEQAGFDYVALGHIHKPQIISEGRMAYSGSLEPLDKNEEGPHGYIIGECNSRTCQFEFVPFSKREYVTLEVDINSEMTADQIMNDVRSEIYKRGKDNIYKIKITGYKDRDMEYNFSQMHRFGNIIAIDDCSVYDYDFEKLQVINRDNIIGMYIDKINQADIDEEIRQKALYYGIHSLYRARR